MNDPSYPSPKKVLKQGLSICSKEISYFENEFGKQREVYNNGQEFQVNYLTLQKAFNKYPKTFQENYIYHKN